MESDLSMGKRFWSEMEQQISIFKMREMTDLEETGEILLYGWTEENGFEFQKKLHFLREEMQRTIQDMEVALEEMKKNVEIDE